MLYLIPLPADIILQESGFDNGPSGFRRWPPLAVPASQEGWSTFAHSLKEGDRMFVATISWDQGPHTSILNALNARLSLLGLSWWAPQPPSDPTYSDGPYLLLRASSRTNRNLAQRLKVWSDHTLPFSNPSSLSDFVRKSKVTNPYPSGPFHGLPMLLIGALLFFVPSCI